MLIVFCFLYLTYSPWPVAGAIWARSTKGNPDTDKLREFPESGYESQADLEDIFPNHALAQTTHRPDCFREATGRMEQRCADLDRLEEDKISFAVSMTLCELEIAHLSPPMECHEAKQKTTATPADRRRCVEALARSAQSWSSYSGYFRESTRMCYAYQQLNDIDIAKNTYRNTTEEGLRLIQFILRQEQSFQKNGQQLSGSIESIHKILGDLRAFSGVFDLVVGNMTSVSLDIVEYVTASLDATLARLSRQQSELQTHTLLEVDAGVSRLLAAHTNSLENAIMTLEDELSHHSETLLYQVHLHGQELGRIMNQVNGRWGELIGGISTLHLSISQASQAADQVGEQLQAHREETAASYSIQLAASKNAEQLALALGSLTSTTQAELQQISNTTYTIRENLRGTQEQGARIWYSILLSACRFIGRGNLPGYHQASENTIFRIAVIVGHLAWSTIWFLLSAMMSASLLPLRYLFFKSRKSSASTRSAPPRDVDTISFAGRHETLSDSPHSLPYGERSHPHSYGKPRRRLRMSLIPERLVRVPADFA